MKNIAIAVGDDLYRPARISAAQLETSVTALIRVFLTNLENGPGERAQTMLSPLAAVKNANISHKFRTYLTDAEGVNGKIGAHPLPPP